jgi:hypothetical protein
VPVGRRRDDLPAIRDNPNLIAALGGHPSESALYRFAAKLLHDATIAETLKHLLTAAYRTERPEHGADAVIDGTFIKAHSNGQRYVRKGGAERKRFSDPDATWAISGSSASSIPTSFNTGIRRFPNTSNCSRESQISLTRKLPLQLKFLRLRWFRCRWRRRTSWLIRLG